MKYSNDIYEIIKSRRSIRSFKDEEIPDEILGRILENAIWAPSGKNFQNWHFYVLKGEKLKEFTKVYYEFWEFVRPTLEGKLKPKIIELTGRFFGNIGNAPVVILAFSDIIPGEEPITSMGSVFLAIQNLLLLAHKEGLGTCVLGRVEQKAEQVKKLLKLENKEFLCGIALGYSNYEKTPPAPPRKDGRIHWL
ncbi:MAG: nitroreductase family protein [Candidatus Cloacimonetes bacterium]|nr:nitroreductase family protein [Candidatus Cloacimonadota bacterium]